MPLFVPARVLDFLEQQLESKDLRIRELERQVDELHRQGYVVPAPPPPSDDDPPTVLEGRLYDLVHGIEDRDSQRAWRAEAVTRLNAGEDADHVASTLFDR